MINLWILKLILIFWWFLIIRLLFGRICVMIVVMVVFKVFLWLIFLVFEKFELLLMLVMLVDEELLVNVY